MRHRGRAGPKRMFFGTQTRRVPPQLVLRDGVRSKPPPACSNADASTSREGPPVHAWPACHHASALDIFYRKERKD